MNDCKSAADPVVVEDIFDSSVEPKIKVEYDNEPLVFLENCGIDYEQDPLAEVKFEIKEENKEKIIDDQQIQGSSCGTAIKSEPIDNQTVIINDCQSRDDSVAENKLEDIVESSNVEAKIKVEYDNEPLVSLKSSCIGYEQDPLAEVKFEIKEEDEETIIDDQQIQNDDDSNDKCHPAKDIKKPRSNLEGVRGGIEVISDICINPHLFNKIDGTTNSGQVCSYSAKKATNLNTHMLTKERLERLFKCLMCPFSCRKGSNLKIHILTHKIVRPHQCSLCTYSSKRACDLKVHMLTHTGERPHKCSLCTYSSKRACDLKVHMLTHTGERPHKCSLCSYSSIQAYSLKTHMLIHTGERPHKCSMCSYSCRQAYILKRHMLTHTGERHKCLLCSYSSRRANAVKKHMLIHSIERLKCSLCSYSSDKDNDLEDHMLIHTGERPHKCSLCSCCYRHSSSLKLHMLTHTAKRSY